MNCFTASHEIVSFNIYQGDLGRKSHGNIYPYWAHCLDPDYEIVGSNLF